MAKKTKAKKTKQAKRATKAKAKTKAKRVKAKRERKVAGQGQSGPKLLLQEDQLNADETAVLSAIRRNKETAMAELVGLFSGGHDKQSNRVRNALRRLVRGGFVRRVDRGLFDQGAPHAEKKRVSGAVQARRGASRKATKPTKAPKATRKDKTPKPEAEETEPGAETTDGITADVRALFPDVEPDSARDRDLHVAVAAHHTKSTSSSIVARATGYSRGFVIPRVKALGDRIQEHLFGETPLTVEAILTVVGVREEDRQIRADAVEETVQADVEVEETEHAAESAA